MISDKSDKYVCGRAKNIHIHEVLVSIETSRKVEYIPSLTDISTWLSMGGFLLVFVGVCEESFSNNIYLILKRITV